MKKFKIIAVKKIKHYLDINKKSDKLGSGTYGKVYKCSNLLTKEKNACKILKNDTLIFREFELLNFLSDSEFPYFTNIKNIYKDENNIYYIEMPLFENSLTYINLKDSINKCIKKNNLLKIYSPPFISIEQIMLFFCLSIDLNLSIDTLHKLNILHRDIKSGNILMKENLEEILKNSKKYKNFLTGKSNNIVKKDIESNIVQFFLCDFGISCFKNNNIEQLPIDYYLVTSKYRAPEIWMIKSEKNKGNNEDNLIDETINKKMICMCNKCNSSISENSIIYGFHQKEYGNSPINEKIDEYAMFITIIENIFENDLFVDNYETKNLNDQIFIKNTIYSLQFSFYYCLFLHQFDFYENLKIYLNLNIKKSLLNIRLLENFLNIEILIKTNNFYNKGSRSMDESLNNNKSQVKYKIKHNKILSNMFFILFCCILLEQKIFPQYKNFKRVNLTIKNFFQLLCIENLYLFMKQKIIFFINNLSSEKKSLLVKDSQIFLGVINIFPFINVKPCYYISETCLLDPIKIMNKSNKNKNLIENFIIMFEMNCLFQLFGFTNPNKNERLSSFEYNNWYILCFKKLKEQIEKDEKINNLKSINNEDIYKFINDHINFCFKKFSYNSEYMLFLKKNHKNSLKIKKIHFKNWSFNGETLIKNLIEEIDFCPKIFYLELCKKTIKNLKGLEKYRQFLKNKTLTDKNYNIIWENIKNIFYNKNETKYICLSNLKNKIDDENSDENIQKKKLKIKNYKEKTPQNIDYQIIKNNENLIDYTYIEDESELDFSENEESKINEKFESKNKILLEDALINIKCLIIRDLKKDFPKMFSKGEEGNKVIFDIFQIFYTTILDIIIKYQFEIQSACILFYCFFNYILEFNELFNEYGSEIIYSLIIIISKIIGFEIPKTTLNEIKKDLGITNINPDLFINFYNKIDYIYCFNETYYYLLLNRIRLHSIQSENKNCQMNYGVPPGFYSVNKKINSKSVDLTYYDSKIYSQTFQYDSDFYFFSVFIYFLKNHNLLLHPQTISDLLMSIFNYIYIE